MANPSDNAIDTAIAWLRCNDGRHGEAEDCEAVAKYLIKMKNKRLIGNVARQSGLPLAHVRKRLREKGVVL